MKTASRLFGEEERQTVNEAIREAESGTSAEIMTVVATDSGRYDRPEDIVGLFFGLACMIVAWALLQGDGQGAKGWEGMPLTLQLPTLVAVLGVGFAVGTFTAMKVARLRRLFTRAKRMREEVMAAARQIFYDQRVHHTAESTGLLIYLSLYERLAVILADQGVIAEVGQYAIDCLCEQLIQDLRKVDVTTALCNTIADAGERLSRALPRNEGDVNQLSDELVTID